MSNPRRAVFLALLLTAACERQAAPSVSPAPPAPPPPDSVVPDPPSPVEPLFGVLRSGAVVHRAPSPDAPFHRLARRAVVEVGAAADGFVAVTAAPDDTRHCTSGASWPYQSTDLVLYVREDALHWVMRAPLRHEFGDATAVELAASVPVIAVEDGTGTARVAGADVEIAAPPTSLTRRFAAPQLNPEPMLVYRMPSDVRLEVDGAVLDARRTYTDGARNGDRAMIGFVEPCYRIEASATLEDLLGRKAPAEVAEAIGTTGDIYDVIETEEDNLAALFVEGMSSTTGTAESFASSVPDGTVLVWPDGSRAATATADFMLDYGAGVEAGPMRCFAVGHEDGEHSDDMRLCVESGSIQRVEPLAIARVVQAAGPKEPSPPLAPDAIEVTLVDVRGGLLAFEAGETLARAAPDLQRCAEELPRQIERGKQFGRLSLAVGPDGVAVSRVWPGAMQGTMDCIARAALAWSWPRPDDGSMADILVDFAAYEQTADASG